MKRKLLIAALPVLSLAFFASCEEDDKKVSYNDLPAAAQQFINSNFDPAKVSVIYFDKDESDRDYEIVFSDGSSVSFDRNGNWEEIYVPTGINTTLIPEKIYTYVSDNHPNLNIIEIDKDKHDIEIELSNSLDIVFDLQYNFVRYDD